MPLLLGREISFCTGTVERNIAIDVWHDKCTDTGPQSARDAFERWDYMELCKSTPRKLAE